jgi:hypothetical protein
MVREIAKKTLVRAGVKEQQFCRFNEQQAA